MAKKSKYINIFSWNVNGIRAIQNKGFMDWFQNHGGNIICLQETKAQPEQLGDNIKNIKGFQSYWFSAEKKGYSSVAVYTNIEPVKITNGFNNSEFNKEGRVIIAEYEKFVLANVYFPNGGRGPERVKYKLDFYNDLFFYLEKNYRDRKGIVVVGDYNTAHKEIDLARPKENSKTTGFLPQERAWIDKIIGMDYIDIFREYNTEPAQYTYWDQITRARDRNVGWRIDYFMISSEAKSLVSNVRNHTEVMGSDHCPIELELNL